MAQKEKPIGEIVHYFDKIKVAVIKLYSAVKIGDEIRISGGENTDFKQVIESMQFDHKDIKKAKKGDEVGMKVREKVREGYKLYRS